MSSSLARMRRDRYDQAALRVFSANDRARSFYQRFVFEPDGREDQHDWSGGLLEAGLRARL